MVQREATYVAVAEGDSFSKMTQAKFDATVKTAQADSKEIPVAARTATFLKHTADSLADAQALVPDEKMLVTYFNRGYGLAEESYISKYITDEDFTPSENGALDLTSLLQSAPERAPRARKAMSTEDLLAGAANLSKDQLAAVIAQFQAALAAAA